MEINAFAAQIDGIGDGRGYPVRIEARGVGAFSLVAVQVKLDGHAIGNTACPSRGACPITQAAPDAAQCRWLLALNGECKTIRRSVR